MHVTACFTCTIFRREIQNCQQGLMKQISACGTLDHMRFIQQILTDTHVCVYLSLCCLSFDISFCSLLNTHTKSLKETVLQIMKIMLFLITARRLNLYRGQVSLTLLTSPERARGWMNGYRWSHGDGDGDPPLSLTGIQSLLMIWSSYL